MMVKCSRDNLILGVVCIVLAVLVAWLWVPLDTETGFIEKVRRQTHIGDALAPTVACAFIAFGGFMLLFEQRPSGSAKRKTRPDALDLRFGLLVSAILIGGFLVVQTVGPVAVWVSNLLHGESLQYRLLRDTVPWKYSGFFCGGTMAIAGTISLVQRRFSILALAVSVLAVSLMIAIYDLPFDDLLLPPNGDY